MVIEAARLSSVVSLLALLVVGFHDARAETLIGRASVIDGDTLEIRGKRIRLWGVDAVESKQLCWDRTGVAHQCGRYSANALADQIEQATVICVTVDIDRYNRAVARCSARGVELNRWLVQSGWAADYTQYSKGKYLDAEAAAKAKSAGNWRYRTSSPAAFRTCIQRSRDVLECSTTGINSD